MKSIYSKLLLVALLLTTVSATVSARECIECKKTNAKNAAVRTKAALCKRAQSTAELNINNVRALINGYGNMWYDGVVAQYHLPKNSNTCPLFCAALWIGGTDVNDQLRIAALRFGSDGDDYWPGPLKINGTASVDLPVCNAYDKHWIITKSEVLALKAHFEYDTNNYVAPKDDAEAINADITDVIANWPAKGQGDDLSSFLAPFYDADGDGEYNPRNGDYPYYDFDNELCPRTLKASLKPGENYVTKPTAEEGIVHGSSLSDQVLKGDQTIWWVFNDMGNTHTESGGQPIGLEIRAQAFAFSTNDEINNMTFYSYEIINRSTYELQETYFSQWVDADLGYAWDDFVGCDVRRGLGYCYNGKPQDTPGSTSYSGVPPAVGIDFFQGPYMDPDGIDNPKIYISKIEGAGYTNGAVKGLLSNYKLKKKTNGQDSIDANGKQVYDTISITDDADLFYSLDPMSWYFESGDAIGNCAINGVNFGNNIIDDERFGMRRFVYYDNGSSDINGEPSKASDYYNYLRGYWKNGKRMKYGGNAIQGDGVTSLDCDFMFPDDSDPWHWGTDGVEPPVLPNDWREVNVAGNSPNDRRFMQSAGPFTLKPGALNYITVGIPFAQASNGDQWSSVALLRQIDDVCQSLFENCFKVLDGPDAPTMTCQELSNEVILYLSYEDPTSNNNKNGVPESHSEINPAIVKSYTINRTKDTTITEIIRKDANVNNLWHLSGQDTIFDSIVYRTITLSNDTTIAYTDDERSYKFEGYQIYQLKDANTSIADINDENKARLIFQCDVETYYDSVLLENGDEYMYNGYISRYDTIKNTSPSLPIGTLVNYTTNTATGLITGKVMVNGANKGIQHVFRVTTDAFATGTNTGLVNNKEYYFIAIAYAQNRYREYSQTEADYLNGQKEPYLAGRKNEHGGSITPIVAIPHNPAVENGGKVAQSEFGMCPNIVRLEGYGNGGAQLRLTQKSIRELMGAPGVPGKPAGLFVGTPGSNGDTSNMQNPCIVAHPQYEENYGPINVRVIDPLQIREGRYNILFWNKDTNDVTDGTRWCIVNADGGKVYGDKDTVWSDFSISRYNEQIFPELGIAVTLVNPDPAASSVVYRYHTSNVFGGGKYYGGFVNEGSLIASSMSFADENQQWLSGIPDNDSYMTYNWIRSGSQFSANAYKPFVARSSRYSLGESYLDEDFFKAYTYDARIAPKGEGIDKTQEFEGVVGGLWSPYGLVSTLPFHPGFSFMYYMADDDTISMLYQNKPTLYKTRNQLERLLMVSSKNKATSYNELGKLPSVRIVFTSDTSKWTRCPVVEMCDDYTQSEGNARRFSARKHASVNKLGKTKDEMIAAGISYVAGSVDDPEYINANGMGWFPGYAISTISGERLNIMFGEDSRYAQYNGRDMMWNPVSTMTEGTANYILGGRHFVYVMNATNQAFYSFEDFRAKLTNINYYTTYRTPSYDAGQWAMKMLASAERMMDYDTIIGGIYRMRHGITQDADNLLPKRDSIALLYASAAWVNMPLVNSRYAFNNPMDIPCDVTIDIDVRIPYGSTQSLNHTMAENCGVPVVNNDMPAYQFVINPGDAVLENLATGDNARDSYVDSILSMINVVPNPYYSYSKYETASQLETKVRIVNLPTGIEDGKPQGCLIRIYTVDGTLVRTLGPTAVSREVTNGHYAESTSVDWDLHNQTGIPIAGGMYLIHVSVPGIGERVIKWFGTMRPVDLNSFGF